MAENIDNLILEHLRHLRASVDQLKADVREIKGAQTGVLEFLATHDRRLGRIEDRLERIETRLGLVDPVLPG
jgi:hypothetical protein